MERTEEEMSLFDGLLGMKLNESLEFEHGRYIKVPGWWVFEPVRGVSICFIPKINRI